MKKIIPLLSFFIFPNLDFNFQAPSGLCVDKNGMVYIISSGSGRIKRYFWDGRLSLEFGKQGEDEGCLDGPMDAAVNSNGDIYIADTWNNRVCVFSQDGRWKGSVGGLGEGKGRFKFPSRVAIDLDDYLYVVDSGNGVIQKFSPEGEFIMEFGRKEGLKWPSGIAITEHRAQSTEQRGENGIYISDTGNNRIMRFSKNGEFLNSIKGIDNPQGCAIGPDECLYIADGKSSIIKLIDNKFIPFIKGLSNPEDVAFSGPFLFVAEMGKNSVLKFSLDGIFKEEWKTSGSSLESLNLPYDIALSKNNIYIGDTGNNRILRFSPSFSLERVWYFPSPIALFSDGENIYCLSSRENIVVKFDKAGNELLRLSGLSGPRDLIVDNKGNILVLSLNSLLSFRENGEFLGTICTGLKNASCVTMDNEGFILISDDNKIKKFSQGGILEKTIGDISSPAGIVVDRNNNIYISEREKNSILKLDFSGNKIKEIGLNFLYPYGLAIDSDENLYIADCGNHRIVVFGERLDKFIPKSNLPDLVIEDIDVLKPSAGIWTKLGVKIKNQGNSKADFISVNFFSTSGRIGFGKIIKSLGPSKDTTINTIWLPEETGTQTLRVVVDQEDKIEEIREENNIKEKDIFVW